MGIWVPIGSELFYCRIVQAALCFLHAYNMRLSRIRLMLPTYSSATLLWSPISDHLKLDMPAAILLSSPPDKKEYYSTSFPHNMKQIRLLPGIPAAELAS